jgi:hypothetical protein
MYKRFHPDETILTLGGLMAGLRFARAILDLFIITMALLAKAPILLGTGVLK